MRTLRLAVSFCLAAASFPPAAVAQARAVRTGVAPVSVAAPGAGLSAGAFVPSLSLPSFSAPALAAPAPGLAPAPAPAPALPAAARAASPALAASAARAEARPLAARVEAAGALVRSLPDLPVSAAPAAAATPDLPPLKPAEVRPPARALPDAAQSVRRMMIGTAAMKSGMETVTLSVPLLALTALGGASMVAALVVAYGVSQAVFAGAAGALSDRFSAHKVLAAAVVSQAVLVGAVVALGATGLLGAATLLPLYVLIGGAVGIAETTRHSIPALILGQDGDALSRYNAKLHISYEVAGVGGALAAGALIAFAGPLWSMLIQPPAYLLASYFFLRVRHARPAGVTPFTPAVKTRVLGKLKEYLRDIKAGAKLVLGDGRLRWVALAFVLPQIVHRVFENLLIPVFAKTVLEAPQSSAWMLTASNLGELLGAVLLLRFAARVKGPAAWVKYGALGLLLIWTLASTTALPILLPLILVSSLSWAASDLSLRSEVQRTVAEKDQPRALSFLFGAFVLGSAAASLRSAA